MKFSDEILDAVDQGKCVALCCDFDGTQSNFVPNPWDARITYGGLEAVLKLLRVEKQLQALEHQIEQNPDAKAAKEAFEKLGRIEYTAVTGRSFTKYAKPDEIVSEAEMLQLRNDGQVDQVNGLRELLTASVYEHIQDTHEQQDALALISQLPCEHYHGILTRDRNGNDQALPFTPAESDFLETFRLQLNALYEKYVTVYQHNFSACHEPTAGGACVNFRAIKEGHQYDMSEGSNSRRLFDQFEQEARQLLEALCDSDHNPTVERNGEQIKAFKPHTEDMSIEIMPNGLGDKGKAILSLHETTKQRHADKDVLTVFVGDSLREENGELKGTDAPAFEKTKALGGLTIQVLDHYKAPDERQKVPLTGHRASPNYVANKPEDFLSELEVMAIRYEHKMQQKITEIEALLPPSKTASASDAQVSTIAPDGTERKF